MTNEIGTMARQSGWVLTYRKSGRTRRFASLAEAKRIHIRAAARYGTRWLSLRPERV